MPYHVIGDSNKYDTRRRAEASVSPNKLPTT